jgi:uncharacterized protein (TIGR03492 family)
MLRQMSACLDLPADWPVLCAPHVSRASLAAVLQSAGWQQQSDHWQCRAARLWLLSDAHFARALGLADLAVGLAGTANEQCVGHGVPVISFASTGTQYTRAFGEAQQRLLGGGLSFLERPHPRLLAEQIDRVLHQPVYREAARRVSNERFGLPGADRRMLQEIQRWFHARNMSSAG